MKTNIKYIIAILTAFAALAVTASAQAVGQPLPAPVPVTGQNEIITLAIAHPWVGTVLLVIGALRACFKPVFQALESFLKVNDPGKYVELQYAERTPAFRIVSFLFDYLGSVKLPVVTKSPGDPNKTDPNKTVSKVAALFVLAGIGFLAFAGFGCSSLTNTTVSSTSSTNSVTGVTTTITTTNVVLKPEVVNGACAVLRIGVKQGCLVAIQHDTNCATYFAGAAMTLSMALDDQTIDTNTLDALLSNIETGNSNTDKLVRSSLSDVADLYHQTVADLVKQKIGTVQYLTPALTAVRDGLQQAVELSQ